MACRIDKLISAPTESLEDSVDVQEAVAFMARRDLGSLVVMQHLEAIQHTGLAQAVHYIHHLGRSQAEHAGLAGRLRPLPAAFG